MSTRSHIGIKIGDKVKYIYCHSDGYLSYNGVYLNLFFRTPERVNALINLGDIRNSIIVNDLKSQYVSLVTYFKNCLLGNDSFFYSF